MKFHVSLGFFALLLIFLVGFGAGVGVYYYAYYRPLQNAYKQGENANQALVNIINQDNQKITELKGQLAATNQSYFLALKQYQQAENYSQKLQQLLLSQIQRNQALANYFEWKALGMPPNLRGWYGEALSLTPQGGAFGYTQSSLAAAVVLTSVDAGNASWAAKVTAYMGFGNYPSNYQLFSNISSWSTPILISYDSSVLGIPRGAAGASVLRSVLYATSTTPYVNSSQGELASPLEVLIGGATNQLEVCELAAALLRLEQVNVGIGLLSSRASPGLYAFALLVQIPNLPGVYYYDNLTTYGISGSSWALISPNLPLGSQNSASWGNQWILVNVELVERHPVPELLFAFSAGGKFSNPINLAAPWLRLVAK